MNTAEAIRYYLNLTDTVSNNEINQVITESVEQPTSVTKEESEKLTTLLNELSILAEKWKCHMAKDEPTELDAKSAFKEGEEKAFYAAASLLEEMLVKFKGV